MRKITIILIFTSIFLILSMQSISSAELEETQYLNYTIDADSPNINTKDVSTDNHDFEIEKTDNLKTEDTNSPGTFEDLQDIIDKAEAGTTVDLFIDYNGDDKSEIMINKNLTIDGHGHTINCLNKDGCLAFYSNSGTIFLKNIKIINGHNSDTNNGGAIYICGSAQYDLENCTFENNWAGHYGGAIYNFAGRELNIKNCRFTSNKANSEDGGAIYSNGKIYVENSIFENNNANVRGGAIYTNTNITITNCTFQNNKAEGAKVYQCYGGAVCAHDVTIFNSTFKDNYAADYGGAIDANNVYINPQSTGTDIDTFFINNKANDNNGGAIYAYGSVEATNAEFSKNNAYEDGGAIYNDAWNKFIIKNCRFTSNKAESEKGGAIYSEGNIIIENSIFDNNNAYFNGGAVYTLYGNITVTNCTFQNNKAEGAKIHDCYGGALRGYVVTVFNSTFKDNYAADYGGAIYGIYVYINPHSSGSDIDTFFINNRANDNNGGAIYAYDSVEATNAEFSKNNAYEDGGAIYACDDVVVNNCLLESNQANGAKVYKCYGGAIRAEKNTRAINSIFRKNYAENQGGAIYSHTTILEGENIFEENVARDHGGAIYTDKFEEDLQNATFINNEAQKGDGGAIYINKENYITISQCKFINNKCGDEGGAIYLDSTKSHLWIRNNIFDGNSADDGYSVYTCGKYEEIYSNFWAGNDPSSDNKQLTEWKLFKSNIHHSDSNPIKLDVIFDWHKESNNELVFNAKIAYFTPENEQYDDMDNVNATYTIVSTWGTTIEPENVKMENNTISFDFHPSLGDNLVIIKYGDYIITKTITIDLTIDASMGYAYIYKVEIK